MFRRVLFLLVFIFASANSLLIAGDIYTWKDENGVLHFSDSPPESNEEQTKTISTEAPSQNSPFNISKEGFIDEKPKHYGNVEICKESVYGVYEHIFHCETIKIMDESFSINDISKTGWTPLTMAIARGCDSIAKYLIQRGADVNLKHSRYGFSPLHMAILVGKKDIAELLIYKYADVNYMNPISQPNPFWFGRLSGTPSETALMNRRYDILEMLLAKGADITVKNKDGKDLMDVALAISERQRVESMLKKQGMGVPVKEVSFDEIMDSIYSNRKSVHGNDVLIPIELIKQSLHLLNKSNKYGDTLLHEACDSGQIEVVKTLLDMGARVNLRNNDKESPIHKCRSAEIVKELIDHGARVNAQNRYGQTLIHLCAEDPFYTDINIVKTAIAGGGNKYIRDRNGKSPYDIAKQKSARQDYLDLLK